MRGKQGPGPPDGAEHLAPEADRLLDVVLRLYSAASQPDTLPAILSLTAPLFDTEKALFVRVDRTRPSDSVTEVVGATPQFAALLKNRTLDGDTIWRVLLEVPAAGVFLTSELMPKGGSSRRPFYDEVTVPAGLEYALGCVIENGPEYFSAFSYMRGEADFVDEDKRILKLLLPHLRTALELSRRIAIAETGRREALLSFDRARQAAVILDQSGYAIHCNQHAANVLNDADGIELKFGRFLFQNVTSQAEFERAVRMSVASLGKEIQVVNQEIRVMRRSTGSPYVLAVIPLKGTSDRALLPDGAACLVLIHDLERLNDLPLDRLAWIYRLTPAEVRICEAIYRFGSVDSTARSLSLARNTVRSHLKSIYGKFGVTNQGQFMQRLANSMSMSDGLRQQRGSTQISGPR